MPVRLRITLLFTLVVSFILSIVCVSIYYFSSQSRVHAIKKRLHNRAITTERLLRQSEVFARGLMLRIDSATTLSLQRKSVEGYGTVNQKVYSYTDEPEDTITVGEEILEAARQNGYIYFTRREKEAVGYFNVDSKDGLVIICAGVDVDGKAKLMQLQNILIWCFIGGILISLAGGYFFSDGLLRPVRRITNEVMDISGYNLTRRIKTSQTSDEWQNLSTTLNELLDRLQESFELQRRFISNASHELSTPLTLISSQLEISLQRARTDEEYRSVINAVLGDVKQMNKLVQTLLQFATAAGNAGGLDIDLVRIDEVLLKLPGDVIKVSSDFSVSLQFGDLPDDDQRLLSYGNYELLYTALQNIVVNACKYSKNKHADVFLRVFDEKFVIEIHDTGIGIAEADLNIIFQPFYRVQETRSTPGFGLGLSLANRIIRLHKGSITVTSEKEVGTTFSITLPAARPV